MNITASYTPTEADVAEGVIAFRSGMFRGLAVGGVTVTVLGLIGVVLEVLRGGFLLWALALLAMGGMMLALRFWAPIQAARKNPHMHGDVCDVSLTDDAYRSVIKGHRADVPWRTFRKIRAVGDQWIFEFNPTQAITVPRRVFTEDENAELAEFVRTLRKRRPTPKR